MEKQIREHYYEGGMLLLRCGDCKQILPSFNFSKDRTKRFGFNSRCKACDKIYHNLPKFKQLKKDYYQSHKQQYKDCTKKWKLAMKEKCGFSIKQFHKDTQEYIKKYNLRPNECSLCGGSGVIEFHHPSYKERIDWKFGVFLCKSCHRKIHSGDLDCPKPVDLIQLNAHMPIILTDKDLEGCKS